MTDRDSSPRFLKPEEVTEAGFYWFAWGGRRNRRTAIVRAAETVDGDFAWFPITMYEHVDKISVLYGPLQDPFASQPSE